MARMAANAIVVGRQRDLAPRWVNRGNLEASKDEIYQTPRPGNAIHLEVSKLYLQQKPPGGSLGPEPDCPQAVLFLLVFLAMMRKRRSKC